VRERQGQRVIQEGERRGHAPQYRRPIYDLRALPLACERINGQSMQGYLAYSDGAPVGWCNAAPRRLLRALDDEPIPDAEHVGTIICFLVEPSHRGRGVARALLEAACDGLRQQGLRIAEGNPRVDATSPSANHFGPLNLYLSAGFAVHRQDDDGSVYVRKAL
jgi:GNAT superfamily N-acetyltransferase